MWHLTLTRPGHPDHRSTAHHAGEIRNAVWDLARAADWTIQDSDHRHLIEAAAAARDSADIHGASLTHADGTAITSRPYDEAEEDTPEVTPHLIIRTART